MLRNAPITGRMALFGALRQSQMSDKEKGDTKDTELPQEQEEYDEDDDESDDSEEDEGLEEHEEVRLGFIDDQPLELDLLSLHEGFPNKVGGKPV